MKTKDMISYLGRCLTKKVYKKLSHIEVYARTERMAHGPQKYADFANVELNAELDKATVARLLRSNGA